MNGLYLRTSTKYLYKSMQGLILVGLLSLALSCGGGSSGEDEIFLGGPGVVVSFMEDFIGGDYIITVEPTSLVDNAYGGLLALTFSSFFTAPKDLEDTLPLPDLTEVEAAAPGGVPVTYPLVHDTWGKVGELNLIITHEDDNPYFSATGDAALSFMACSASGLINSGEIKPTSPTTVVITAIISDLEVKGFTCPVGPPPPDATLILSLKGRLD